MRYSIRSPKISVPELMTVVQLVGGGNVKALLLVKQVFADLDDSQVSQLKALGLIVKAVKGVTAVVVEAPKAIEAPTIITVKAETELAIAETFKPLRDYFTPPLTGVGLTVAVIDSGIRATHEAIRGRVILEENYSSSPSEEDNFDHGSNIASIILAISPSASLMNIKVLSDGGIATEEEVVAGIERVCELVEVAKTKALLATAELWPNVINLSMGSEDDADYDNTLRVACRVAVEEYGLEVIAAVGNSGPKMSTIMSPATDELVIGVGSIAAGSILEVASFSSRGPTLLGDVKPDFLAYGEGVEVASSKGDTEYLSKSGTSFSVPVLSGARGLLDEIARRAYGEQYCLPWCEIEKFAPLFCIKPEGAPLKKDNTYGYGFPSFGAIASQMVTKAPVGIEGMIEAITPLITLSMLSMIMGGMGGASA